MTDTYSQRRLSRPVVVGLLVSAIAAFVSWHFDLNDLMNTTSSIVVTHQPKRWKTSHNDLRSQVQSMLAAVHAPTNVSIPDSYVGDISPMWKCSKQTEFPFSQKLIFVHIFKTAGSSFRRFFDDYSQRCQRGFSLVIHCSQVSATSMLDSKSPWESAHHKVCMNRFSRDRNEQQIFNTKGNVTGELLTNTSDILIGHLPLGVHLHWKDYREAVVDPTYVLFMRDPIAKYVSGRLFVNNDKHWDFSQAIHEIKSEVLAERNKGAYYLGCDKYMITPEQKGLSLTLEERVEMVRVNLVSHNCIVGIVERMSDSLALIQLVVDSDLEVTDELRRLDTSKMADTRENRTDGMTVNKSELSTSALVAELKKDEHFFPILLEYLKYEMLVYDYAIQIHERQVESLFHRFGDRYFTR